MKKLIVFLVVFCMLTIFDIKCFAASPVEHIYQQFEIDELVDKLPGQTTDIAEEMLSEDITVEKLISMTPSQIFLAIRKQVEEAVNSYRTELLTVITAVLFLTMLNFICADEKQNEIFELVCTLSITSAMLRPVLNCISSGCEVIKDISQFMLAYVPVYTSVLVASGAVSGAVVYQTVVFAAAQIINQLSNSYFLPLMHGYMLLTLSGAISKNKGVTGISVAIKKLISWSLILITTAFTGILSFQSFMGTSADSAFSKTAKFLAGSFVPVIGSAFADALSAINGSMRIIKAVVGGIGVSAVVLGFLPIIVNVTVLRASLLVAKIIADAMSVSNTNNVISGLSDVLSVLTALLVCTIMLLIISTAIMMSTATSLVM